MQQPSMGKVILKTALITSAVVIVVCVVGAAIVFFCFPLQGYKFFDGMSPKASLFFAEQYAGDGNLDGYVYCIDISDNLLDETGEPDYAFRLAEYTQKFFEDEDADDFIARLDEYYIANSAPQARVGLFSYYEHLVSLNFKARTVLGKDDEMIFRGVPEKLDDIFASELTALEKATVYSAVTEQLKLGKNALSDENGNETQFGSKLSKTMPLYLTEMFETEDSLEQLFLMRKALGLITAAVDALPPKLSEEWNFYLTDYNVRPLTEVYADLLNRYIND